MAQNCGMNVTEASRDAGGDHHVPETQPRSGGEVPDVPNKEGHPPSLMAVRIQDWNVPVKIKSS